MRLVVTTEARFEQTPDGRVWTPAQFGYGFWQRYLQIFEQVRVVARVRNVLAVPAHYSSVGGLNVEVYPTPYFIGPLQFMGVAPAFVHAMRSAIGWNDAVILRVPSFLAMVVEPDLAKQRHPFAVEVVGDPYEVFRPGSIQHPLRPLLRWWFTQAQKRQCRKAVGAAYVTEAALQKRYPIGNRAKHGVQPAKLPTASPSQDKVFETHYSSVELPWEQFPDEETRYCPQSGSSIRLISVGTLENLYKAPDILLRAFAVCLARGLNAELSILGDGRCRMEMERLAETLGVRERVTFRGLLPHKQVFEQLDAADLFVLPSRVEGLPRALIEAMARGLPCIGSTVGGIPELLPPEYLVPPNDIGALASKIIDVVADPIEMSRMSAQNLARARDYSEENLAKRRNEFYGNVRSVTEAWLDSAAVRISEA